MENELLFLPYGSRGLIIKFEKPSISQIEILSRSFFRDYVARLFKTDVQDLLLTSDSLTIFFKESPSINAIKKNLLNAYDISLSKSIDFEYKHWEIPVCFENNFSSDLLKYFNDDESKTKDYIKRPGVQLSYVLKKLNKKPKNNGLPTWCYKEVLRDVETDVKYEGYIKRHLSEIQKISKNETLLIDKNTNYSSFSGLSTEAIEKLSIVKPETFGQACRISGVSPADVSALMVYLFKS